MWYLDRLEVAQEHAIFENPSMFLLTVSVGRIISPPSCKRLILSFRAIVGSIYGFANDGFATLLVHGFLCSSSFNYEQKICNDVNYYFNFVLAFFPRVSNTYRIRSE